MDAMDANRLRALICALRARGLEPSEIARRVGCGRTTVYKVLKAPGPDRRSRRGRPALSDLEAGRAMALIGDGAAASRSEHREDEVSRPSPYAGVAPEAFARAAAAAPGLADEVAYTRVLLRQIFEELQAPGALEHRHRLWASAARLLSVLAQLQRAPAPATEVERLTNWLAEIARAKQAAARQAAETASPRAGEPPGEPAEDRATGPGTECPVEPASTGRRTDQPAGRSAAEPADGLAHEAVGGAARDGPPAQPPGPNAPTDRGVS